MGPRSAIFLDNDSGTPASPMRLHPPPPLRGYIGRRGEGQGQGSKGREEGCSFEGEERDANKDKRRAGRELAFIKKLFST